jgi:sugar lactone lactonase YvrE
MIFRFTPEGKYVNKFAQSMESCGIAVDNQSRIYVSGGDGISVYNKNGEAVSGVPNLGRIDAFTLDAQNNVYALTDDRVIKRNAVK